MRFKARSSEDYYVLVQEGIDLKAGQGFHIVDYIEFAKAKEKPHLYYFDKTSGKILPKGVRNQKVGKSPKQNSPANPDPIDGGHLVASTIGRPHRQKATREGGSSEETV